METTHTSEKLKFTIDDLKIIADYCYKSKEKELPKGLSWFTKLMNKFGWHRKYEVLVIDKEVFKRDLFKERPKIVF